MNPYDSIQNNNLNVTNIYQDDTSFMVIFHDGYTFRLLMEYIKSTCQSGNIIFNKTSIVLTECNEHFTILNDFKINTIDLVNYQYKSSSESYIVAFSMEDLLPHLKSVTKKKSVKLLKKPNSSIIYIQVLNSYDEVSNKYHILKPKTIDTRYLYTPPNIKYNEIPNCVVPLSIFCKDCGEYKDCKYGTVTIRVSSNGIVLTGNQDGIIDGLVSPYGNYNPNENEEETQTIELPDLNNIDISDISIKNQNTQIVHSSIKSNNIIVSLDIIKTFSKFIGISPGGTVKFYKIKNSPLKLVCNIGTCGILSVYLK